jgi:hypothetical protein
MSNRYSWRTTTSGLRSSLVQEGWCHFDFLCFSAVREATRAIGRRWQAQMHSTGSSGTSLPPCALVPLMACCPCAVPWPGDVCGRLFTVRGASETISFLGKKHGTTRQRHNHIKVASSHVTWIISPVGSGPAGLTVILSH